MTSVVDTLLEQMGFRLDNGSHWFVPLEKALDGVTAPIASWRPNNDFNTIWQIVNHLTVWTKVVSRRLLGETVTGIDNEMTFGEPGDPTDESGWEHTLSTLYSTYRDLRNHLEKASPEDMNRIVNSAGFSASTEISGCLLHDSYHIGQIVLLRKLQGERGKFMTGASPSSTMHKLT